ncbi:hypothetical protein GUJ93_ZPchr0008g13273 [Zizania palustris]|uniref:C2H2-type domain-containing protein n=1 Tax=Zizania palustris TaxID=103762 RepID=A0A8J5V3H9_ZIZPA|nr:hypothetical protein GUJ93_ZPchr0008g13273 [Zizania palustris]
MDPNGSFPQDAGSSSSNNVDNKYISPLHEVFLRGTTAIPQRAADESFAALNSSTPSAPLNMQAASPYVYAPQGPPPAAALQPPVLHHHSHPLMPLPAPYQPTNVAAVALPFPPPPPPPAAPLSHQQILLGPAAPASHVNTTISEAALMSGGGAAPIPNHFLQIPPALPSFLTSPMSDYLNSSHQMQILSTTEPPPVTSLLQGDPFAVVHAHLNTTGVLDNGPIFQNSAMATMHIPEQQQQQPFGAGQGDQSSFGTFLMPPYVPMEQAALQIGGGQGAGDMNASVRPIVVNEKVRREYTCKLCNAKFRSPQAYGGHMSFHSKMDKKNMPANPPQHGD